MNEEETKLNYITPALKKAGWGTTGNSSIRMEFSITDGKLSGHGRRAKGYNADYVLQYKGRNLAVIEAKKASLSCSEGVAQAKLYANLLFVRYTYSSNGKKIYAIDMDTGEEKEVDKFPSPDELFDMTFTKTNEWLDKFLSVPFESKGGLWDPRYYQENAITKTLEAVANNKKRILLTLATGTGKTAIAFQIVWKLFKSKWTLQKDEIRHPRILFLADRNILASQAYNSFSAFEEDALVRITPKDISKKGKVPTNGNIFFTIFQSFMTEKTSQEKKSQEKNYSYQNFSNPSQEEQMLLVAEQQVKYQTQESKQKEYNFGQYPKDFFDFIIIDECHRAGANELGNWHEILNYFSPAVQLGLTATPRRDTNADTYDYFGDPIYTYSLKEGVEDGFLTPFRVKQITSDLDTYKYKTGDVIIEGEVDKDKCYTKEELDKGLITVEEREKSRAKQLLDHIGQNEKTLVFCRGQKHAADVRNLINQQSKSTDPDYCHRVVSVDGLAGEQHLSDFQDNEKIIPTVLTTSHKLSTGVDAPEVKNIVLFRPVNSMIEFKQIIGRGTRLSDGKDYFTIYDFVDAHHHFQDPEWDGEPEPCEDCNNTPCICEVGVKLVCKICNTKPCVCIKEEKLCKKCEANPCLCNDLTKEETVVKLSDGRSININTKVKTTFWGIDGKQITAEDYLNKLFNDLPNFFKQESELRKIWSIPETRDDLLNKLKKIGYAEDQLNELKILINAQNSDLFDVLSYISFNLQPLKRSNRAKYAEDHLNIYDNNKQDFLKFVLKKYIDNGVVELSQNKLPDLLKLQYGGVDDATTQLGELNDIKQVFIDFQKYLYQNIAV